MNKFTSDYRNLTATRYRRKADDIEASLAAFILDRLVWLLSRVVFVLLAIAAFGACDEARADTKFTNGSARLLSREVTVLDGVTIVTGLVEVRDPQSGTIIKSRAAVFQEDCAAGEGMAGLFTPDGITLLTEGPWHHDGSAILDEIAMKTCKGIYDNR